ncbi:hypothetical protein K6V98_00040 [Collinsella sp. AGMB00827]|uniref:Uncharacterized protein n=1 Tax=Collinsella ureilytica TaxID=2869515 RepID=A0ABS7MHN2_9ACTN|nr:hypothetical protein [Collinsella urealyticum]MBY4796762.1 hypothetical protein [Collinsella urealyticum]
MTENQPLIIECMLEQIQSKSGKTTLTLSVNQPKNQIDELREMLDLTGKAVQVSIRSIVEELPLFEGNE